MLSPIIGALIALVLLISNPAKADGPHASDPPTLHAHGWFDGKRNAAGEWCCGEGDCFEVEPVRITAAGYHVLVTGETIPYSEAQPSPDGKYWRCKRPDGSRRCFFAPPPAM